MNNLFAAIYEIITDSDSPGGQIEALSHNRSCCSSLQQLLDCSFWYTGPLQLSLIMVDRQFESNMWSALMSLLGTKCTRTTSYHPQSNGMIIMVECFHRQLKASLKTCRYPTSWMDSLPLVMLGICTSLKEDMRATMAEMVCI